MNMSQAIAEFCHCSSEKRFNFLLRFSYTLPIVARDTYAAGEDGLTHPPRLRRINEVQHRVLGFLIALQQGDVRRYPEDVLVKIMIEHPEDPDLRRHLQEVFCQLMGQ